MKKWILAGILFRLLLMPFTSHPDIRGHYLGGYLIAQKGALLGVYDYISRLPRTDPLVRLYGDDFLVYSPLTYWSHAVYLKVLPIPLQLLEQLILDMGNAANMPGYPYLLFLLKLPYLFVDLAILWLLLKISNHRLVPVLWAFNLPLIYSAFLMGQFDIFLVLAFVAAIYFSSRRPLLAAVNLALGAGFKPFPLFLLPFLPGSKVKNITAGLLTYLLIISPYLSSPAYRMYALLAQQSDKMWYAKIMVAGSQYLPLFMVGFILIFWLSFYFFKRLPFWAWPMSVLLLFYSVTHYHPQWFAWITPFLILTFIHFRKSLPLLVTLLLCHLVVVLSFDTSLNFGLFGLKYAIPISDQYVSFVRGALAASSLALVLLLSHERV